MPSTARKRKRKSRFRLYPSEVLWFLVFANLAAGFLASPATGLSRVRVEGAAPADEDAIAASIQKLRGVPFVRQDRRALEAEVEAIGDVAQAELQSNVFGRGVLKVVLRAPVAEVSGQLVYLDGNGVFFKSKRRFAGLPRLALPEGSEVPNLCLSSGVESHKIAELCKGLADRLPNLADLIALDARGVLSFETSDGFVVVLGSAEDLARKLDRLESVLKERPDLPKKARRLVLTAPDSPVVKG
ncbi:MAG: cell division protein FtsQ/DivIB [Fimbriimonadaceae bacterium]|nr:cell division protein FtsQ/DivIB [Fimbriimonadaceae bacterium]QYK55279.1 MAG: cell division protein FtsQ/DivIB [Fimbriimonadaceae bacterium]